MYKHRCVQGQEIPLGKIVNVKLLDTPQSLIKTVIMNTVELSLVVFCIIIPVYLI